MDPQCVNGSHSNNKHSTLWFTIYSLPQLIDRNQLSANVHTGYQAMTSVLAHYWQLNLQWLTIRSWELNGLMYSLILCVNNGLISYLQRRLVAATDYCCACKQLVPAPWRLTRMTPSLVRSLVCLLPSLFTSIMFLNVLHKSSESTEGSSIELRSWYRTIFDSEPKSRMQPVVKLVLYILHSSDAYVAYELPLINDTTPQFGLDLNFTNQ